LLLTVFHIHRRKVETVNHEDLEKWLTLQCVLCFRTAEKYAEPILLVRFNNSWNTIRLQGIILNAIKKAFEDYEEYPYDG